MVWLHQYTVKTKPVQDTLDRSDNVLDPSILYL